MENQIRSNTTQLLRIVGWVVVVIGTISGISLWEAINIYYGIGSILSALILGLSLVGFGKLIESVLRIEYHVCDKDT